MMSHHRFQYNKLLWKSFINKLLETLPVRRRLVKNSRQNTRQNLTRRRPWFTGKERAMQRVEKLVWPGINGGGSLVEVSIIKKIWIVKTLHFRAEVSHKVCNQSRKNMQQRFCFVYFSSSVYKEIYWCKNFDSTSSVKFSTANVAK